MATYLALFNEDGINSNSISFFIPTIYNNFKGRRYAYDLVLYNLVG
tara:strand:- start:8 stop:145 length:138 start_codon:yes stop_codon:yes gene_type:complete